MPQITTLDPVLLYTIAPEIDQGHADIPVQFEIQFPFKQRLLEMLTVLTYKLFQYKSVDPKSYVFVIDGSISPTERVFPFTSSLYPAVTEDAHRATFHVV